MKNNSDLISACIVWEQLVHKDSFKLITDLYNQLSEAFEFFEILLLIHEDSFKNFKSQFSEIDNLRFLILRTNNNYYAQRTIVAKESIGDIVIISSNNEVDCFDFSELATQSLNHDSILIAKVGNLSLLENAMSKLFSYLGKIIGLGVALGFSRTIVFPRTQLNLILGQDYEDLKLRFPPSNLDFKITTILPKKPIKKSSSEVRAKSNLLYMFLLNLTPILLRHLTVLSCIGLLVSFFYILYALITFVLVENIQLGWLTLSLSISGTALFLCISIFIISIAIQHMFYSLVKDSRENTVYEIDSIDIFKKVKNDLNIAISQKHDSFNK